jgi:hypothetical protein
LIILTMFGEEYKLRSSSLCDFLQSPVTPSLFGPNILQCPRFLMNFRKKLIFYGEELLAPRPTPKLRTTPCRLSATDYSIYS